MREFEENYLADVGRAAGGARDHRFDMLIRSPRAQVVLASLPPGQTAYRQHSVNRASDQIVYVIEGEASASTDGTARSLHEGNILLIKAGQQHQVTNVGSSRLLYLNIIAGDEQSEKGVA